MDVSPILDPLNDAQRDAVAAAPGSLLVLAGAGSGKTRVLAHRIAWLVQVEQAPPWSILAVTFTNKAAREMRARILEILDASVSGMWIGTFHGLAHRFLRAHWQDAGLTQTFQIIDSDDQIRLIRRVLKALNLDEARWVPRQIQGFINRQKDEGLRPEHLDAGGDFVQQKLIDIYHEYEQTRGRGGLLDFADLLLYTIELLRAREDILTYYRRRFRHLLVDEFQDTNAIQYAWLRLLAGPDDKLFAVGDDDQSIYGWRGARVENLRALQQDYPRTRLVRLEQNYRSSGTILEAANALIAHNPGRLGKQLWTQDGRGTPIRRYRAFNDRDEARFVVDRIQRHLLEPGSRHRDCAILYRTTAQSRLFEETLIQAGVPYRIHGGLRFFERAEIRDAVAWLRLLASPDDDAAFERVINVPPRGIGARTLDLLREHARATGVSLWRAARALIRDGGLGPRGANALGGFMTIIETQRAAAAGQPLATLVEQLLDTIRLAEFYRAARDGKGEERIENLAQLVSTARRFEQDREDDWDAAPEDDVATGTTPEPLDPLAAFLARVALETGEALADGPEDRVQLMTLHAAKGLEFPLVFLVGLEERLFPHSLSADSPERLEEERRLCYVGMTRAMRQLYVTHAEVRALYGREDYPSPSRFLGEIPAALVEEVRVGGRPSGSGSSAPRRPDPIVADGVPRPGQRVRHPTFGEGRVLAAEGQGAGARVQVAFGAGGTKWLVLAHARLETLA